MHSLNDPRYVRSQYQSSDNLNARIALHEHFSTAMQDWHEWVFDHFDFPRDARVLEIGCGTGLLWSKNRTRIPADWKITLSDFSIGMLDTARAAQLPASFLQCDAQSLPFTSGCFDAAIANHMLYHVPDLSHTLFEIRRVLTAGGKFFAATNGVEHLCEYYQLVANFLGIETLRPALQFTLENGEQHLAKYFSSTQRFDFDDNLIVTEAEPLVAYAFSGVVGKRLVGARREEDLRRMLTERIARDGAIRISKATGLFAAQV